MAYHLAGTDKAYDEDCVDDGEIGAGHHLLDLLVKEDQMGIVVVVVWFYGGTHIGSKRHEILIHLASIASMERR